MSESCREQLRRRQKLVSENYKVSRGLAKACKDEIKANKCRKQSGYDNKTVRLAEILLCLEGTFIYSLAKTDFTRRKVVSPHPLHTYDTNNLSMLFFRGDEE